MQTELGSEQPELPIHLAAINEMGHETGNDAAFAVADLPFVQDDEIAAVWTNWAATWRDVQILDGDNHVVAIYNLTEHDLADEANYAELKAMLISTAEGAH